MKDKNAPSMLVFLGNSDATCIHLFCLSALSPGFILSDPLVHSILHMGRRHFAVQPRNLQT